MSTYDTVFAALSAQARISFSTAVSDFEQHVVPSMAALAQSLVVIGQRRASGVYDDDLATNGLDAQKSALAAVIARFANDVLAVIDNIINAVLKAFAGIVNTAVGVAIL